MEPIEVAREIALRATNDKTPGTISMYRQGLFDRTPGVASSLAMYHARQPEIDALKAAVSELVSGLGQHHKWHLDFDLDDPEHGFNYATEYQDSTMCERTCALITKHKGA